MVKFCFRQWQRLPDLISRCWKLEAVEDYVENAEKPRIDILKEARARPCVCAGQWQPSAKALFANNALREQDWRYAVLQSVEHGRSKGTLVCHAGHAGNEGKSFLFAPLAEVFGEDQVFSTPPPGSFPLVGLERHRGVLLDDWRFNEDIVGYPLQLLWFEGKPIVIASPEPVYWPFEVLQERPNLHYYAHERRYYAERQEN